MPQRLFCLLSMLWVGSQVTVGYLVAPSLFARLAPGEAGVLAGSLFRSEALIGVVCGILLLALGNLLVRRGAREYRRVRWLVLAMLLCVLLGYFVLQPFMSALHSAAESGGADVGHSPYARRFGLLHGVSSALYVLQSLLGLWLAWRLPCYAPAQPAGPAD